MLSGNLELFALTDVLKFVARSGATGAVNVYRDVDGGRILLVEGEVVGAVVEDLAASDADGVVDVAMRLMDGAGGDFALELEAVSGPTRQPVEDFLKSVGRRRAEWRKILASVGSMEEPLDASALVPAGSAEISLTPLEWHIAVLIDGNRSLRDIAHEAGTSEFATATAILAMSNAGLLALTGAGAGNFDGDAEDEDDVEEDGVHRSFDEENDEPGVEPAPESKDESDAGDEDDDPAQLLRELGEQRQGGPRSRRVAPASRQDQRVHLRSR
ncbi:MAG: DUF4388 domain-containing protein [Actinomycetota bacterium]